MNDHPIRSQPVLRKAPVALVMERWRQIATHPDYEVSDLGRVRRVTGGKGVRAGRILVNCPQLNGYMVVNLYRNGVPSKRTIHRLVMEAFSGPCPEGMEVNHLDADKAHNALYNLEYCTPSANRRHAAALGVGTAGERNGQAKLTDDQVIQIRERCLAGESQREVARAFGICQPHVSDLVRGRRRRPLF